MPLEWREHKPGQWWQVFNDAPHTPDLVDERGTQWPPSMVITWGGQGCCLHLYSFSNGAMPGDGRDDDVDYLHICDLDDFIEELQAARAAMEWKRPAWDER